jgi:hypothetical protein
MPIDIEEIVDRVIEQKCVFLLGPGLAKNKMGETLRSRLLQYFDEKQLGVEEGLDDLYTCDTRTRTRALDHLQKYCRDHSEPNDSHEQLALIPCHLYISTTPDLLMKKALEEIGVKNQFEYYVKDKKGLEKMKPTRDEPLLYNLFGCIDNQESIIFSQWDLIQYLFSIIQGFSLPDYLRESLKNANYFIFLGFDFETWYLKLMLKLILGEFKPSIATEEGEHFNEKLKSFYQRRYGLEFVDTNIEAYINDLYNECSNRGLLRERRENVQPSIQSEVQKLIGQDEVKQALERLINFIIDESLMKGKEAERQEFINELYNHSGVFDRNEKMLRRGLITAEAAKVDHAKIRNAVLDIAGNF